MMSLPTCFTAANGRVRLAMAALTIATATLGVWCFTALLAADGVGPVDLPLAVLFAVLFLLVAFSFWTATLGLAVLLHRPRSRHGLDRAGASPTIDDLPRTAIVVPIYNEDANDVFAGVRAIVESLRACNAGDRFDLFLLSDTTNPEIWLSEELAWAKLVADPRCGMRVFYRHRPQNISRKAGNIADFCARWGAQYPYMIVLDADSIMRGSTLVEMVRRMERDPQIGILQVPPVPVGRRSLFARVQQFASQMYGPVFLEGFALWSQGDGNYWGHNAVIRTQPFIENCGLPLLPGDGPLGGEILSHDFVEAALMRRAGWKVCLAHDLGGSYETCPTTILDYARRDQRWCQGNLQHARLLLAEGMHPASRLHMGMGVMSYLSSPLWLLFLVLTIAQAAVGSVWLSAGSSALGALWLFAVTMAMLLMPKAYGVIALLRAPQRAERLGGWDRVIVGVLLETLISILVAPIMMLLHTRFVVATLAGHRVVWNAQPREDREVTLADAWAIHWPHMLFAIGVGIFVWLTAPGLLPWLALVLVGPLAAIPLSMALGSARLGLALARAELLLIAEEVDEPTELRWKRQNLAAASPAPRLLFDALLYDPAFWALHLGILRATDCQTPAGRSAVRSVLEALRSDGCSAVSPEFRRAVLNDPHALEALHIASRLRKAPQRSCLVE